MSAGSEKSRFSPECTSDFGLINSKKKIRRLIILFITSPTLLSVYPTIRITLTNAAHVVSGEVIQSASEILVIQ